MRLKPGERAVVVVNHRLVGSTVLLLAGVPARQASLRGRIPSSLSQAWWMQPAQKLFRAFPVDPTNPMSAKAMVKAVREGNCLVIFPEGRITVTGALMKVFDGPGMVADKADAPIIPVRIDGAQYSPFSKLAQGQACGCKPLSLKITLTVLSPRTLCQDRRRDDRASSAARSPGAVSMTR